MNVLDCGDSVGPKDKLNPSHTLKMTEGELGLNGDATVDVRVADETMIVDVQRGPPAVRAIGDEGVGKMRAKLRCKFTKTTSGLSPHE